MVQSVLKSAQACDGAVEYLGQQQTKLDELICQANNWRESQFIQECLVALRESLPANTHIRNCDKPAIRNSQESRIGYIEWGLEQADRLDPFSKSPCSVLDRNPRRQRCSRSNPKTQIDSRLRSRTVHSRKPRAENACLFPICSEPPLRFCNDNQRR